MLRRSLLVSAVLLAGSFGFASSAKAADAPVFFEGNIATSCGISQTAAGTLASTDGKTLSSSVTGGSAATIEVDCPGGTVSVVDPAAGLDTGSAITTNKATTATTVNTASVALDTANTDVVLTGTVYSIKPTATTPVNGTVNMTAASATKLPAGDYGYSVLVTVTP